MSVRTHSSQLKTLVLAVATSAAFLGLSSGAHADDAVSQVKVDYSDLDLSNEADAKRLYQRLRAAAGAACSSYDGRELYKVKLKRECTTAALDRAVSDVNSAAVLALHDARSPVKLAS
ncbi:MAG: UrcA family protein, partial [Steroidobacteraceae bacterium]